MALTLSGISKGYLGGNILVSVYLYNAAGSGDTLSVTIPGGVPFMTQFSDANGNVIVSNPPTFGSWTTTGGSSAATLTANSGGVITNGRMLIFNGAN